VPYNQFTGEGTGFSFMNYNAHELQETIWRSLWLYRNEKQTWERLVRNAMSYDSSWERSAGEYVSLYRNAIELKRGI
jgi:starch synthase